MLFPTKIKCKIASGLSYPVGAEIVSAELGDIPQASSVQVAFFDKYQRMENRGLPYTILSVCYAGDKSYDPGWNIEIRPVSKPKRAAVKDMLKANVFPRVREWMSKYAAVRSRHSHHTLNVILDETSMTIRFEEFHSPEDAVKR